MLINNSEYLTIVTDIKSRIRMAQHRAIIAANAELFELYWNIGVVINEHSTWGNKFIENIARDIKLDFPDAKGYSARNLRYMAKFAKLFPDYEILQTLSAKLMWSHCVALIDKVKDRDKFIWYAERNGSDGWSVDDLKEQIERGLYERQVIAHKTSNFQQRLLPPQGNLAAQTMKDPYVFDFIAYREGMIELEIEAELVRNITKLLLELGTGFAFMGNQYQIEVENEIFKIDLLFYNVKLRCYVVIELKRGDFKPEYAGKLNFYISAVDDLMRGECDNPTIGLLLCKNKRGMIAEYSLRDIEKPIGVSEYKLFDKLPEKYADILPSAEDIEKRIGAIDEKGESDEGRE
ncbi:MAG: PDDEXK nuclease domain-containing protein [Oscillospiraceae bacterium]|jgi:predicted nuclease of restriction endonuclease-like (RecB) superfamily|nr:PDDEXK nuclease domain-containing protein [Oscillospiraceae bacterium]